MAWEAAAAALGSSLIGGYFGNKAAKTQAGADRYAVDQQMRPYNLKEPYYSSLYSNAQDALDNALATGAYTGNTYASMDPRAAAGYNYLADFGTGQMGAAANFMNQGQGFGSNFQNIFNRASGPTLDNAIGYATSSPQAQSMIDAAMRDSDRRLNEQTLPGIGLSASATNNTRGSRNAVAQAIAQRGAEDRRADVASDVYKNLTNQYLRSNTQDISNMMRANEGLKNTYGIGFGMGSNIGNMLAKSGAAFQTDAQGQLDANRDRFERERDFAMGQYSNFNSLLGGLPSVGPVRPSTANPYTATLSGAMMGFGVGNNLYDMFKQRPDTTTTSSAQPMYNPNYVNYMGY